jgi:cysteine desulfurase
MPELVYLDHNATTPVDPRVFEAMRPFFLEEYGNAASPHAAGQRAAGAVERARAAVAAVIGAEPREIVWTSGATESDNLAILGVARAPAYAKKRHVVTVVTEHRAVLDPCAALEAQGYELTRLPVDGGGRIDLDRLASALRPDTLLVSVMHANNEIGLLHPLAEIGRLCKAQGVLFHTDATQSFGKEEIDVRRDGLDLLSASAHKLHGPKGVGLLYVRHRSPHVRCQPLLAGGGHERGLRSGTLNVPGIVGFGAAAELCRRERPAEQARIATLRDRLERALVETAGALVNGASALRLANTTNLSFPGIDARSLLSRLPDVALSTSSACTSATVQPSHVLAALGLPRERIDGSLRFSLGRFTTAEEIDRAVERVRGALELERRQGPAPACAAGSP